MPSTSSLVTALGAAPCRRPDRSSSRNAVGEVEHVVDVVADEEDADAFLLELHDQFGDLRRLLRARAPPSARP